MRSLATITPGPAWTDGRSVYHQDPRVLDAHLDTMRQLYDAGALLLGGPTHDGRSGLALFETGTLGEATALMAADPAVRASIFTFRLHRLAPYFDAFDGTRHR